jgi:hypothetical protein
MQTGADVISTVENESGSAKHENRTQRPQYRSFWVVSRALRHNVLHSLTRFGLYRGSRVKFSCFALTNSFSAILWESSPVSTFSVPGLDIAVPTASGLVFMLCDVGLIFSGIEGADPLLILCASILIFNDIGGAKSTCHELRS